MKGQSSIEFLGAVFLFTIAVIGSMTVVSGKIPQLNEDLEASSKHMEVKRISDRLLTDPGFHEFGSGGTNWEKNSSTVANATSIGLADDYKEISRSKLEKLETTGDSNFNYTQFREITGIENQYRITFTWLPVIATSNTFTRTMPPENPPINNSEPQTSPPDYNSSENRIHYGGTEINGSDYNFLVAAFDGVYNTTYMSENNWDFTSSEPKGVSDDIEMDDRNFTIVRFQNRDRRPGSSIILERRIKTFGPQSTGEETLKFNRYGLLTSQDTDPHPIRLEVLSW